jgi:phage FluMu gp28-like protein
MTNTYAFKSFQRAWFHDRSKLKIALTEPGPASPDARPSLAVDGIAWALAGEAVEVAAVAHGASDVRFVSRDIEHMEEFVRKCASWSRAIAPAVGDKVAAAGTYRLDMRSGHSIMATTPPKLRGQRAGLIIVSAGDDPGWIADTCAAACGCLMRGGRLAVVADMAIEDVITRTFRSASIHFVGQARASE